MDKLKGDALFFKPIEIFNFMVVSGSPRLGKLFFRLLIDRNCEGKVGFSQSPEQY